MTIHGTSLGLNFVSESYIPNSKSVVQFLLVYFEWWSTILGMVGDHPVDGGWPSMTLHLVKFRYIYQSVVRFYISTKDTISISLALYKCEIDIKQAGLSWGSVQAETVRLQS